MFKGSVKAPRGSRKNQLKHRPLTQHKRQAGTRVISNSSTTHSFTTTTPNTTSISITGHKDITVLNNQLTSHQKSTLQRRSGNISSSFRQSKIILSNNKFADTWTKQAKALGYPSRAVFKLIQAQKKFKIIQPGDVVVDLGCSPGSWSKLSSTIASGNGFVLGMDLTTLSPQEQSAIGVRPMDVNKRFEYPRSYDNGQGGTSGGLLATERKLLKNRAPVAYMQQDVTQWIPGAGFQHQVDVLLSDMAPQTTGITSADSSNSIDLCYSVVDLCSQLFKPPSTKIQQFTNPKEKQDALIDLKNDPNHENVVVDQLVQQFNKNMEKHYGANNSNIVSPTTISNPAGIEPADGSVLTHKGTHGAMLQHTNSRINLKMIKKTLKQHVYLQKPNAIGIVDTDEASAIYKTNERTLSQIKGNEQISTTWRGTLMMKVFQGEGITDLMNLLKSIFVSTYVFKPESSRTESVEVFIICKGYCGPFDHTRITNKHIRRPKTEEYLRSYTSNNKKRPQVPHDPTKSPRFHEGFTPDSPLSKPVFYDERSAPKRSSSRGLSLDELYKQAAGTSANASYTSDSFKEQQQEQLEQEHHFDQLRQTIASGVTTNVHAVIKNTASLDQGAMSPLKAEISGSDDLVVYHRDQFDRLYNQERVVNQVPDTQSLIKSMSLFWDEGTNFAKKMAVEAQSPHRIDIFKQSPDFTEQFKYDEVRAILDDASQLHNSVTAESLIAEHQKATKKKIGGLGAKRVAEKATKAVKGKAASNFASKINDGDSDVESEYENNAIDAVLVDHDDTATTKVKKAKKSTKKTLGSANADVTTNDDGDDATDKKIKETKKATKKAKSTKTDAVVGEIIEPVAKKRGRPRLVKDDSSVLTPVVEVETPPSKVKVSKKIKTVPVTSEPVKKAPVKKIPIKSIKEVVVKEGPVKETKEIVIKKVPAKMTKKIAAVDEKGLESEKKIAAVDEKVPKSTKKIAVVDKKVSKSTKKIPADDSNASKLTQDDVAVSEKPKRTRRKVVVDENAANSNQDDAAVSEKPKRTRKKTVNENVANSIQNDTKPKRTRKKTVDENAANSLRNDATDEYDTEPHDPRTSKYHSFVVPTAGDQIDDDNQRY